MLPTCGVFTTEPPARWMATRSARDRSSRITTGKGMANLLRGIAARRNVEPIDLQRTPHTRQRKRPSHARERRECNAFEVEDGLVPYPRTTPGPFPRWKRCVHVRYIVQLDFTDVITIFHPSTDDVDVSNRLHFLERRDAED